MSVDGLAWNPRKTGNVTWKSIRAQIKCNIEDFVVPVSLVRDALKSMSYIIDDVTRQYRVGAKLTLVQNCIAFFLKQRLLQNEASGVCDFLFDLLVASGRRL